MNKTLLFVLSAILFSPNVSAENLMLRVTTLGYEDAEHGPDNLRRLPSDLGKLIPAYSGDQDGAGDPKDTILRSIETQIIPGKLFAFHLGMVRSRCSPVSHEINVNSRCPLIPAVTRPSSLSTK